MPAPNPSVAPHQPARRGDSPRDAVIRRREWGFGIRWSVFGIRCSDGPTRTPNTEYRTPNTRSEATMSDQAQAIEALLEESRVFPPTEEFRRQANVADEDIYERARRD